MDNEYDECEEMIVGFVECKRCHRLYITSAPDMTVYELFAHSHCPHGEVTTPWFAVNISPVQFGGR